MTRYYFDLVDGPRHFGDSEGTMLLDPEHAIGEARRILGDVVRDGLADDRASTSASKLSVEIRTSDASIGRFRMTLSFEVE